MTTPKMMDEILSYCSKCKLELNHRVTRIEGNKLKKVLCLTCKAEHAYRKSAPTPAGTSTPRKTRVTAQMDQEVWQEKLNRGSKSVKPYGIDKPLLVNDHVRHQLFGTGLVVALIPPDKASIFFQDSGLKLMKCGN